MSIIKGLIFMTMIAFYTNAFAYGPAQWRNNAIMNNANSAQHRNNAIANTAPAVNVRANTPIVNLVQPNVPVAMPYIVAPQTQIFVQPSNYAIIIQNGVVTCLGVDCVPQGGVTVNMGY